MKWLYRLALTSLILALHAPAFAADDCGDKAVKVAADRVDLTSAKEVRAGYWPAVNLCHALVILSQTETAARVMYVWYGLPGHPGSQVPGKSETVEYDAKVMDGAIVFNAHWGPEITYLSGGRVTYLERRGLFEGTWSAWTTGKPN